MPEQVSNPLTLVMEIKSAEDYDKLRGLLDKLQSLPPEQNPISVALTKISTVHFARFVFLDVTRLAVITTYDGDFAEYIEAFVREIGHVFDQLLVHMKDAPPLPVGAPLHRLTKPRSACDIVALQHIGPIVAILTAPDHDTRGESPENSALIFRQGAKKLVLWLVPNLYLD